MDPSHIGEAGIIVTWPKPGAKAAGRFGKRDFINVAAGDIYRCPAVSGSGLRYLPVQHLGNQSPSVEEAKRSANLFPRSWRRKRRGSIAMGASTPFGSTTF